MKTTLLSTVVLAGLTTFGAALPAAQGRQPDQTITVVGCVHTEADYRRANDKGKGGVVGTGVGVDNEYVLTNVLPATASDKAAAAGGGGTAYELSGPNEKLVAAHVGKRVEITGMLKAADVGAGGKPTGGKSAIDVPKQVGAVSQDLKLRELEVSSVKAATGTCPAR